MPPQTITMAIWLLQELIQHEPEIAAEVKALLTKADPTDADWDALHAKVHAKSYADYVPASALPPAAAPGAALPADVKIKILPPPETSAPTGNFDAATTAAALGQSSSSATPGAAPVQEKPAVPLNATLNSATAHVREQSLTPVPPPAPAAPAPAPAQ
jgi:hypothetical protein